MFTFFEKKHILGVDLGTSSIKVVELKVEKDGIRLVNFGIANVEESTSFEGEAVSRETKRLQYLSALLERIQPHTKEINVSISGSSGLISVIELPKMRQEELAEAVQFEAHKYVPIDLNDVAISWDVLGEGVKSETPQKSEPLQEILLVAALKKDIQKTVTTVERTGFSIGAMELEIFSLARSLVGDTPGTHLIIDIGYHSSNLVLVSDGNVYASRGVDVGGGDITKTIMDGMNIAYDRAESLKKERDFFHQNEIPLSFLAIENVLNEARRIRSVFEQRRSGNTIDSLILSGGSSLFPGLEQYCSEQLGIPANIGDPWKRVRYDEKQIASEARREAGAFLAVAIGLALHSLEK